VGRRRRGRPGAELKAEIDEAVRANEAAGRAPLGWMFDDVLAAPAAPAQAARRARAHATTSSGTGTDGAADDRPDGGAHAGRGDGARRAVVVLGEDVGKRGGVFLATEGLFDRFGPDRVIDTPLSEAAIIGAAVGMAVHGMRPVAEIQFADYVFPGFDQLVSQAAKLRYRSGGGFTAPMVVRMPAGGGVAGGHHHSQNPESHFVHTPGPAGRLPLDAQRRPRAAAQRRPRRRPGRLHGAEAALPRGQGGPRTTTTPRSPSARAGAARGRRRRADQLRRQHGETLKAADALAAQGVSADVIDLRSLLPWDEDLVLERVARVGRVVVISEAPRTLSFASEVAATIAEEALDLLEAPPVRVTGFDTPTRTPRTAPTCPARPHPARRAARARLLTRAAARPAGAGGPVPEGRQAARTRRVGRRGRGRPWLVQPSATRSSPTSRSSR
jgi:2-oxoisovalerate dehydrogenase E1 component beta subunit